MLELRNCFKITVANVRAKHISAFGHVERATIGMCWYGQRTRFKKGHVDLVLCSAIDDSVAHRRAGGTRQR